MIVKESIAFKRTGDSKKSLGVGAKAYYIAHPKEHAIPEIWKFLDSSEWSSMLKNNRYYHVWRFEDEPYSLGAYFIELRFEIHNDAMAQTRMEYSKPAHQNRREFRKEFQKLINGMGFEYKKFRRDPFVKYPETGIESYTIEIQPK